jgi:hypothetical protein
MKQTEIFKNSVTKETEKNDLEARKKEFEEFNLEKEINKKTDKIIKK